MLFSLYPNPNPLVLKKYQAVLPSSSDGVSAYFFVCVRIEKIRNLTETPKTNIINVSSFDRRTVDHTHITL